MTTDSKDSEVESQEAGQADDVGKSSEANATPTQDVETELSIARDKYMRLAAEFENFKKRTARERMELINSANDNLLLQVLETVDNFERALDSAESGKSDENPQKLYQALHEGAKMIHQQLLGILRSHGVEEIESAGEPFDPAVHEAVVQVETDEHPEDYVAQVVSKGYKRGERVLRHSQVGVASKKKTQE